MTPQDLTLSIVYFFKILNSHVRLIIESYKKRLRRSDAYQTSADKPNTSKLN